jgi:hypothetical protein
METQRKTYAQYLKNAKNELQRSGSFMKDNQQLADPILISCFQRSKESNTPNNKGNHGRIPKAHRILK